LAAKLGANSGALWAGWRRFDFKSAAPALGNAIAAGEKGLSRACVVEKNVAWWKLGQYDCLKFRCETGIGIATKIRRLALQGTQAKTFSRDVER
jgi:hypothetical protein